MTGKKSARIASCSRSCYFHISEHVGGRGEEKRKDHAHILPYTGKGADWGKKGRIDADLAVEDINKSGGINGHPLEIINYDSAGAVQQAILLTRKAAQEDKVFFILGPYFSAEDEVCFPHRERTESPHGGPNVRKARPRRE